MNGLLADGSAENVWALSASGGVASAVPVPAAVWLFGSALGLLGWLRQRQAK
jgi:hypothetical protein